MTNQNAGPRGLWLPGVTFNRQCHDRRHPSHEKIHGKQLRQESAAQCAAIGTAGHVAHERA